MTDHQHTRHRAANAPPVLAGPPQFGDLLRRLRRAAGLTQEQLAARAALGVRSISDLERGINHRPQRETLRLLADALNLPGEERTALESAARGTPDRAPDPIAERPLPAHNLPAPATPLIGRDQEIARAYTCIRRDSVRLLTLTGPGGVGKTRLALAIATRLLGEFTDGVCFVSLAIIRDPDFILPSIAQALGVREMPDQSLYERVIVHLRDRSLLLVLDNFEHLLAEAVVVANLLSQCPRLTILTTSRARLNLRGEQVLAIPPLALPDTTRLSDLAAVARAPAVALYCRCARAVYAEFSLTAENVAAVAGICARLDGLPLALELAAVHSDTLPPAALLARLTRRLPALTQGGCDRPVRQRTMRDAIAWSDNLLSAAERRLFRQLAVFVGSWTLEAAQAVADADGTGADVLDGIESLVTKSRISLAAATEPPRYTMLETVREYGLEQLAKYGEEQMIRRAHAAYYHALVMGMERTLAGSEQMAASARLAADIDNVRAAMHWTVTHHETAWGLAFGWEIWRFWLERGDYTEGRAWLVRFLAPDDAAHQSLFGHVAFAAGALAVDQQDLGAAHAYLDRARAVATARADRALVASVDAQLGRLARQRNDLVAARAHCEASLAIRRELGTPWHIAVSLQLAGCVALEQRDTIAARAHLAEGMAIARCIGDRSLQANLLRDLAEAALVEQAFGQAATLFGESLACYRAVGHPWSMARCLDALAAATLQRGDAARAARLLGAAAALRETIAAPLIVIDHRRGARTAAAACDILGRERFIAARDEGAALPLAAAIAAAIVDSVAITAP